MKHSVFFLLFLLNILNINAYNYRISNKGKNLIKKYETCSLKSYWDSNGYSIGYGHHNKSVKKGQHITRSQADKYFNQDIVWVEDAVNRMIEDLPYTYRFSQGFIDGLGSLVYNCGEGGVRGTRFYSTLKRCRAKNGRINKQDLAYAINMVRTTKIKAEGHRERRLSEMKLMLD